MRDYSYLKATQFKPGQSGNPTGRPPKDPLTKALEEGLSFVENEKTKAQMIADELFRLCLKADSEGTRVQAIREILNRVAGKPKQQIDIGGDSTVGELIKAISNSITEAA